MGRPLVSVILPVYNGAAYIRDALQSILSQTYSNFELILINDGSTDESASIIHEYSDDRIRYYEQSNQGLAATLNRGIELANGKYLARQDQDDISLPDRFEKQVAFLKAHPDHGMVGTWATILEGNELTKRVHRHPTESRTLKFVLLFDNPFVHSSLMIRKDVFNRVGLYSTDKERQPPEDYELWSRVAREFELANIPEALQIYREVAGSMSRAGVNPFLDRIVNLSAENLAWLLSDGRIDRNISDFAAIIHGAYHRVSPEFSFSEAIGLLSRVVKVLNGSSESRTNEFEIAVRERFQALRSHYLKYRFGKKLGRVMSITARLVNWPSFKF